VKLHKPFDLEEAKRGEPVEYFHRSAVWTEAEFVAVNRAGRNVVVYKDPNSAFSWSPIFAEDDNLRMVAKKVTVRYRVAIFGDGESRWPVAASEEDVVSIPKNRYFIEWIHTDWQEVEIPQ
jgi:hypothetical protein